MTTRFAPTTPVAPSFATAFHKAWLKVSAYCVMLVEVFAEAKAMARAAQARRRFVEE